MVILNKNPRLYPGMKCLRQLPEPEPEPEPEPAFSGRYVGQKGDVSFDLRVDVDKLRQFSDVLNKVSGTLLSNADEGFWDLKVKSIYFQQFDKTPNVEVSKKKRVVTCSARFIGTSGQKWSGKVAATFNLVGGKWKVDLEVKFGTEVKQLSFTKGERKSEFFRDVKLDIDHAIEKVFWPTCNVSKLEAKPAGMEDRKLDAFSAFEDAGIKLHFNEEDSQKVDDPTPETPWSRADLYDIMVKNFDKKDRASNIWCMMGNTPPDRRFMGFSFNKDRMRGFGLFLGHKSFEGYDSNNETKANLAQRRVLHNLVHECGHCLGLKHPFEIGQPDSLSWMNYAWLYDQDKGAGSFYESFGYRFSMDELFILRHSPDEHFMELAEPDVITLAMGEKYNPRSEITDEDEEEEEEEIEDVKEDTVKPDKPTRKIELKLKFKTLALALGGVLGIEASVKNKGKLPVVIEGDLKPESGNLQIFVTSPDGKGQSVDPYIKPIKSGYNKPTVLYSDDYKEGADRYSDLINIGDTAKGYAFPKKGTYTVKAKYTSGKYSATSETYTVNVVDPPSNVPYATGYKAAEAASLGGSSYKGFEKVKDYYNAVVKSDVETQKGFVASMIELLEGLTTPAEKSTSSKTRAKPYVKTSAVLEDTKNLVKNYHESGTREDNIYYSKLVMKRAKMYHKENDYDSADTEFNQMMADLVKRDVKYEVLKNISNEYEELKNPKPAAGTYSAGYLQGKLQDVIDWSPKYKNYDNEDDFSGLGLAELFNDFNPDHIEKAGKITDMLENKYEETKDLEAVMSYADVLQKGRVVHHKVVQYAVKAYVAHSHDTHAAGMKYPEPKLRDESLFGQAAMISIKRKGETPTEDWMNYWRSDADFNDHHQHWHAVYQAGRGRKRPHLERQGELFGYMHSQMLARYDAERESWGLKPVKPWQYTEIAEAWDIGAEFHNDPQNYWTRGRRSGRMPPNVIESFQRAEGNYLSALQRADNNLIWKLNSKVNGEDAYYVLDPNWSGHALEPTTSEYDRSMGISSLHNMGHGIFGSMTSQGFSSYMSSTTTAVRDYIFFRWHKRIDDLWQRCNSIWYNDLSQDAPPIMMTNTDVVITHKKEQPKDFGVFSGKDWKVKPQIDSTLNTQLVKPTKLYEWDDKLQHDPFFYHIRFKRDDASKDARLTFRIFICPEKVSKDRRRWIEMDKFVYSLKKGQKHAVFTRSDEHSSVIKRNTSKFQTPDTTDIAPTTRGFCECGWPYTMLLPRGTPKGEKYKLCVFVSDNEVDSLNAKSTCGSMSYCGAQDREYPDARPMGYPFSTNSVIDRKLVEDIPAQFQTLGNAAIVDFKIKNTEWDEKYDTEPEEEIEDSKIVWPANEDEIPTDEFYSTRHVNRAPYHRVIIYDNDAEAAGEGHKFIRVRFKGRGKGNGEYGIKTASIAEREGILGIKSKVLLMVNGQESFLVPEAGVWTDKVAFNFDPALGDYAVTFALQSAGCALFKNFKNLNTYKSGNPGAVYDDWNDLPKHTVNGTRGIHCLEKIESS